MSGRAPGGVVRVYADSRDKVSAASFIPYCSMAQAQLSFHGHRDAVKFFCAVPGYYQFQIYVVFIILVYMKCLPYFFFVGIGGMSAATTQDIKDNDKDEKPQCMLVISGGEGYVDFRIGMCFI